MRLERIKASGSTRKKFAKYKRHGEHRVRVIRPQYVEGDGAEEEFHDAELTKEEMEPWVDHLKHRSLGMTGQPRDGLSTRVKSALTAWARSMVPGSSEDDANT